jgi:hypothetical protein
MTVKLIDTLWPLIGVFAQQVFEDGRLNHPHGLRNSQLLFSKLKNDLEEKINTFDLLQQIKGVDYSRVVPTVGDTITLGIDDDGLVEIRTNSRGPVLMLARTPQPDWFKELTPERQKEVIDYLNTASEIMNKPGGFIDRYEATRKDGVSSRMMELATRIVHNCKKED